MLRFLFFPLLFFTYASIAQAGAWTLPEGQGHSISQFHYYATDSYVDAGGNASQRTPYKKMSLYQHLEYGLEDDLTLGMSVEAHHVETKLDVIPRAERTSNGLGNTSVFLRQSIHETEASVASVQGTVILPVPAKEFPNLGHDRMDAEIRTLYGFKPDWFDAEDYVNLKAAYRYRGGDAEDQWRFELAGGFKKDEDSSWVYMPQAFITVPVGSVSGGNQEFDASDDYEQVTVQFSTLYKFTDDLGLQFGAYQEIYGRNTGQGRGQFAAIWHSF